MILDDKDSLVVDLDALARQTVIMMKKVVCKHKSCYDTNTLYRE